MRAGQNVESLDLPTCDVKDVSDRFIKQERSFEIVDDLVYFNDNRTIRRCAEVYRIVTGIDYQPLIRPILPYCFSSVDVRTPSAVCPGHIIIEI